MKTDRDAKLHNIDQAVQTRQIDNADFHVTPPPPSNVSFNYNAEADHLYKH